MENDKRPPITTTPLITREEMPTRARAILEYLAGKTLSADEATKRWALTDGGAPARAAFEAVGATGDDLEFWMDELSRLVDDLNKLTEGGVPTPFP